jgi:serine/threonine protein kinase
METFEFARPSHDLEKVDEDAVDGDTAFSSSGVPPVPARADGGPGATCVRSKFDRSELVLQKPRLGTGAFATTWKAVWWRSFGCTTSAITVVVKLYYPESGQPHLDDALLAVSHPNLAKYFEATTEEPYLVISEYCAGGSLHGYVHNSDADFSWRQRLQVLIDAAKAMEYLHGLEPAVLHRDLRSANVLLAAPITDKLQQPVAKLSSFGCLCTDAQAYMARCAGKWRWMAPELLEYHPHDERTDIFSFGILMFEVLAWEAPYADTWPAETKGNMTIEADIVNGRRPSVQLTKGGCPSMAMLAMEGCWAGDPNTRPAFSVLRLHLQSALDLVTLYGLVKNDVDF